MELRCPDCCSPEVAEEESAGGLRCGNCGAGFERGEALVSVAEAEATYLYEDGRAHPHCFERAGELVGAVVRHSQGREWTVESAGEKRGRPTIRGRHYWDRPDAVEVLRPAAQAGEGVSGGR